jgi:hypothetical protein
MGGWGSKKIDEGPPQLSLQLNGIHPIDPSALR